MANNIELTKEYLAVVDEKYKKEAVTADLLGNDLDIQEGKKAGEYLVANYDVTGLGDYSRNDGYTNGSATLTWETLKADYDRGVKLTIDTLDNIESSELAFGRLLATLLKQRVVPEGDAHVFAKICGTEGISKLPEKELKTGKEVIDEIVDATSILDDNEVPDAGRILYIRSGLYNMLYKENLLTNKDIFGNFEKVVKVPPRRFYTAIKLLKGKEGEEAGHYEKAEEAKDLNFMIVEKSSVVVKPLHIASDIIVPANNPNADAYIQKYRKYDLVQVFNNKKAGIVISPKNK